MRRRNCKRKSAFTLIEVLLVAGILAVLAAVALPRLFGQAEKANIKIAKSQVDGAGPIASGLQAFQWAMGRFPTTDEGLAALYEFKGSGDEEELWDGPYMERTYEQLKDPWSKEYEYRSPGDVNEDSYDLWSRGPDKKDDEGKEGSDDVKNWVDK
ncbi:MAG: type II secretion system major pseudopilin GspG [Planctomycetes bacterium]|nr:type II secretion system major pseudopilin GspG [Planctomycetota bacterium]